MRALRGIKSENQSEKVYQYFTDVPYLPYLPIDKDSFIERFGKIIAPTSTTGSVHYPVLGRICD